MSEEKKIGETDLREWRIHRRTPTEEKSSALSLCDRSIMGSEKVRVTRVCHIDTETHINLSVKAYLHSLCRNVT